MASGTISKYADGTDTGWVPITKDSTYMSEDGILQYRKIGPIVEVRGAEVKLKSASERTWILLGQVPSGYRPTQYSAAAVNIEGEAFSGYVHTNGNIFLYRGSSSVIPVGRTYFNCMYFI